MALGGTVPRLSGESGCRTHGGGRRCGLWSSSADNAHLTPHSSPILPPGVAPVPTDANAQSEGPHLSRWVLSAIVLLSVASLTACSLSRPDRVVEPDAIGVIVVVESADRSDPSRLIVRLQSGETIEIDQNDALDLGGPGIDADRILLYGHVDRREWFATSSLAETARPEGCYTIHGGAAFDEPNSVVLVFASQSGIGIRLLKRNSFEPPPEIVRADGRYVGGVEGTGPVSFCIDPTGAVFGFP